jgi:pimeloyl-ACP methyl ester carboxylesterase
LTTGTAPPIPTADHSAADYRPTPCPPDTVTGIELPVTCGYLRVLESRSTPSTREIDLFVVRVSPTGIASPDPVITLGFDLPWTPNYPGIAPAADRLHREVVILSQRGSGRSAPSLVCTELEALHPSDSPDNAAEIVDIVRRDLFLAAVSACHDRLVSAGIDLSAYNLAESAADVEDLRLALGFDQYNLTATGSSSRIAFEVMRRYPDAIRSAILTSASAPQVDMFTAGIEGTRSSLAALATACAEDTSCATLFPDLEGAMASGLARLFDQPILVHDDYDAPVLLDDVALLHMARGGLSNAYLPNMPAAIYELIRDASAEKDAWLANVMTSWPILAQGFVAPSEPGEINTAPYLGDFSQGLLYSISCHDQLPFANREALIAGSTAEPWYRRAYVDSAFVETCQLWDVGVADGSAREAVTSSTPTLLLAGRFDPHGAPGFVRAAAEKLSTSWVVEIPSGSYNVLGMDHDCPRSIRNAWIDSPTTAPDTGCIEGMPPIRWAESLE